MPGIPKSTACAKCKSRRIKCDEKWPACTSCKRKKMICPGPSSLIKFVYSSPKSDHKHHETDLAPTSSNSKSRLVCSWADAPPDATERLIDIRHSGNSSSNDNKARYRVYRLNPRPAPTADADHVGALLVSHLETTSSHNAMISYLQHVPKLLSTSRSLQDSVNLLCSLWTSARRGQPASIFIGMPEYGKVIYSLRRTLESNRPITLGTLASATLLGRIEHSFTSGESVIYGVHPRGIAGIVNQYGPPKPGDDLHQSLLSEVFRILTPYWFVTGDIIFLNHMPWKEHTQNNTIRKIGSKMLEPFILSFFDISGPHCDRIHQLVHECNQLREDPYQIDAISTVSCTLDYHRQINQAMAMAHKNLLSAAIKIGEIVEEDDRNSIAGSSYHFSSFTLAELVLFSLRLQFHNLTMYYNWAVLYSLTEKDILYADLKGLAVETWKFIRFLRSIEFFDATMLYPALWPSLKLANEAQKESLLDLFVELDNCRQQVPRSRKEVERRILSYVAILTGCKAVSADNLAV